MDKLKNIEEIEGIVEGLRADNKKIITTNGSFDILHAAHIRLINKAREEGDVLIVLLNSDSSIRRNKGEKRPIVSQEERASMLGALEDVDYVIVFEEDTPLDYLRTIKPDKHIKGGSWDPDRMLEEKNFIESWGGEYKCFELEEGLSTTNIIKSILEKHTL